MRSVNFPFRLGTYTLLITALVHLIGHFYKRPPANDQERQLLELMTGYQMDVGAIHRTVQQVLSGFSLSFAVLLIFVAALDLALIRSPSPDPGFVRRVTAKIAGHPDLYDWVVFPFFENMVQTRLTLARRNNTSIKLHLFAQLKNLFLQLFKLITHNIIGLTINHLGSLQHG